MSRIVGAVDDPGRKLAVERDGPSTRPMNRPVTSRIICGVDGPTRTSADRPGRPSTATAYRASYSGATCRRIWLRYMNRTSGSAKPGPGAGMSR